MAVAALAAVARAGVIAPGVLAAGGPLAARAYGAPASYAQPALPVGTPLAYAAHGAVAKSGGVGVPVVGPVGVGKVPGTVETDFDPNPQYSYAYDIQDALTGDSKSQQETRNGDAVQGSYSLVEPDGTRRTVEYTADPVNGFNAVVHREPVVVAAKAVVATPGVKAIGGPLHTKAILG